MHLSNIFEQYSLPHCKEVKPLYIGNDFSQIEKLKQYSQEQSWEGLMLNLDTPYVCKRTDTILKVKVMQTADLRIIGFEEGTGKNVGKLGAAIVNYKGFNVGVGSGFSDYDRNYIWNHKEEYLNKIAEIQYFEESKNQDGGISLRFPVYKKLRLDKTEESYN
jgi:DNA ligase-1